jgi:hypothetical protein
MSASVTNIHWQAPTLFAFAFGFEPSPDRICGVSGFSASLMLAPFSLKACGGLELQLLGEHCDLLNRPKPFPGDS